MLNANIWCADLNRVTKLETLHKKVYSKNDVIEMPYTLGGMPAVTEAKPYGWNESH
jgi:hypothetical protein